MNRKNNTEAPERGLPYTEGGDSPTGETDMSQDQCTHERTIGGLQVSVDSLKDNIEELKQGQRETIRILEKISAQETRLHKMEADQEETFVRLRAVEMDLNTLSTKAALWAGIIGALVAAVMSAITRKFFA